MEGNTPGSEQWRKQAILCHVPELIKMPQKVGRVWQLLGGTLVLVMGLPIGVGAGLCGPDLGQVWRVKLHGPLGQEGQGKVRGTPSCSLLEITRRPLCKSPL